ncbi:MAG: hypothetical protein KME46_02645 [Brasilonema angustatum HA4187-MV1]|nr:hypothetical protein [Brasilonema angustatum HA4187-MV1]
MTTESKYQLVSLDESYMSDLSDENQSTVSGGTLGLLSFLFGGYGYGYGSQQPTTTVVNNIYVSNGGSSSASAGSSSGSSSGGSSGPGPKPGPGPKGH